MIPIFEDNRFSVYIVNVSIVRYFASKVTFDIIYSEQTKDDATYLTYTTQCKLRIYTRMQVTPKIITISYTTSHTEIINLCIQSSIVSTDHIR